MSLKGKFASFIALSALICGSYSNQAFAQNNVNLGDAIAAALKFEPQYNATRLNSDMAQAGLSNAKANEKSSIGLQGSWGFDNADFGMGYDEIYPRSLAIAYEKRLFDGGQALARISAKEFELAAQNGAALNAMNQLIVETAEAYANLYVAQKALLFADDNLTASTRFARDAGLQFQAGETAVSEKAMAEAALHRAEALKAGTQAQVTIAGANLYRLTNLEITATSLEGVNPILPASETEAKLAAKQNHPLIAAAKAKLAQADAQYKLANASTMPNISVSARAQTIRDQFLSGYKQDAVGAFVNFSMPLYTNGRKSSALEMANIGKEQARLALMANERAVEMGITQAYANYRGAMAQKIAASAAKNAMQIAMKSTEAEMRVGQRPMADVLDARKSLTEAMMEEAKAEANILIAKYKIIAAMGGNNY